MKFVNDFDNDVHMARIKAQGLVQATSIRLKDLPVSPEERSEKILTELQVIGCNLIATNMFNAITQRPHEKKEDLCADLMRVTINAINHELNIMLEVLENNPEIIDRQELK